MITKDQLKPGVLVAGQEGVEGYQYVINVIDLVDDMVYYKYVFQDCTPPVFVVSGRIWVDTVSAFCDYDNTEEIIDEEQLTEILLKQ